MIIIDELKHNKFENVSVPKAGDLFARVGPRAAASTDYSGEDFLDPSASKLDIVKNISKDTENADV